MNEKAGLPIIPDSREDDLHPPQAPSDSQLNLFMAGNQFMVMEALIADFKQQYPNIRRIYYQTLPPGLQLKQILTGGAIFRGHRIDAAADIYTSVSESAMEQLAGAGKIEQGSHRLYLHNRLVLLVPSGNPAAIAAVADLAKENVRISQPDPLNEDIAYPIMEMYRDAGGDTLVRRIMDEKRALGTTIMTVVHHRETPLRLQKRTVDVGPVWGTEAAHALNRKLPIEMVDPGPSLDQHQRINYYICKLTRSPHPENAEIFLQFMATRRARAIYERYGFIAPSG